ncbi:hypothetical protein [Arthrobacter sp. QXT-31]|uniref:hypothetical protein n=1 Tax=Arthrobacter sp. QXT-31 TaxID=1357915 RepID=UPI001C12AED4|nr:hypothetical protein [Arthrobacter sp. QXT-31]
MATERDMLDLLLDRYTDVRRGTISDRWVRAEHVRSGMGYSDGRRIADFVAADKHPGGYAGEKLALHGHEVKVTRADWLQELRDPTKADAIKRYMHHWWLVVPHPAIVKPGELPDGWGLLVPGTNGKLRAKKTAPRLNPEPAPLHFIISLMGASARTAHREPLRRDAPVTYGRRSARHCGVCNNPSPCSIHQPRAAAAATYTGQAMTHERYPSLIQWLRQRPKALRDELLLWGGYSTVLLVGAVIIGLDRAWPAAVVPFGILAARLGVGYLLNREPLPTEDGSGK